MATAEAYASLFTGDELDYAISHALGNKYRGNLSPGCHLIGESYDLCVDLDDLLIPGKYTIHHYINGPAAFLTEEDGTSYEEYDPETETDDDAPPERLVNQSAFTVRPIYLQIYLTGGDHLYQTIMVGAKLYWRDMYSAENLMTYDDGEGHVYTHIPWRSIDLGIESSIISNSFEFMEAGVSMSQSQRMGTAAIDYVRRLAIGNANLLDFTNGFFLYSFNRKGQPIPDNVNSEIEKYWAFTEGSEIETIAYEDIDTTMNVSTYLSLNKMPLFDDIDDEIITLFRAGNNGAFSNYYNSNNSLEIVNKIAVSANTAYTASVYLIYDPSFIEMDDSARAFISIGIAGNEKTSYIKLNTLASANDYQSHDPALPIPNDAEFINHVYDNTDYKNNDATSNSDFKHYNTAASERGFYRLSVTLDSNDISTSQDTNIRIAFGVVGGNTEADPPKIVEALFVLPKVEYGVFATQYNHSWGDLYYYFTNCESIFGVPIIKGNPTEDYLPSSFSERDGLVYTEAPLCAICGSSNIVDDGAGNLICETCGGTKFIASHFNVEPIAVGGGGGFVQHTDDDLSIFSNDTYEEESNLVYSDSSQSYSVYDSSGTIVTKHGNNDSDFLPVSYCPDGQDGNVIDYSHQKVYGDTDFVTGKPNIEVKYPRYKDILFLNKQTGELMCWDEHAKDRNGHDVGGLVSINKCFVIREAGENASGPKPVDYQAGGDRSYVEAYAGKNRFWIQKPSPNATPGTKSGTLKYWDPDEQEWLSPLTEPTGIYKVQPNAPGAEWAGKFWINSTTGVMYYYDYTATPNPVWRPLYAAWGSNPSV